MNQVYLEATQETGAALFSRDLSSEIVMLNLLQFREIADYSASPELGGNHPLTGFEAFQRYIEHTSPFLKASGGEILFLGRGDRFFIGPQNEKWDFMMLIKQRSLAEFLTFASNEEYLKGIGHRTAAVQDSRILPLVDFNIDG